MSAEVAATEHKIEDSAPVTAVESEVKTETAPVEHEAAKVDAGETSKVEGEAAKAETSTEAKAEGAATTTTQDAIKKVEDAAAAVDKAIPESVKKNPWYKKATSGLKKLVNSVNK